MTADDIITAARAQLGTPYQHQGRIPGLALDCAGLAAVIARQFGLEYIERLDYGRIPHRGLMESTLDMQPCLQRVSGRRPGDLLLMAWNKQPNHVAIFAGDTIIHSYQAVGRVCEHALDQEWQRRIVRVYRFRDIEQ